MANTYKGKSTKLGAGGRFEKLEEKVEGEGKSEASAKAIAAAAGRSKHGNSVMNRLSERGKKRSS